MSDEAIARLERMVRPALTGATVLLLSLPTALHGQASVYRARLDSLRPRLAAARHAADSVRALRAVLPTDSVSTPHLTLLVNPQVQELVRRAAQQADSDLTRAFGARTAVLRNTRFAVGIDTSARERYYGSPVLTMWSVDTAQHVTRESSEYGTLQAVSTRLRNHGAHDITASLDQPLRDWAKRDIPWSTADIGNPDNMRSQLVGAGTDVGMQCTAGSVTACEKGLALAPTRDRITEWYSAAQRRELVMRRGWAWRRGSQAATFDACVDRADDARCLELLRAHESEMSDEGIPSILRMSLLRFALDRGGPGAFDRLATDTGDIGSRLAAAAGMPQPALVSAWRDAVLKPEHATEASDPVVLGSSLLWCAGCLALALWRSRWS
ncbi:MAG: hypothetical protein JWO05_1770 [Gemmatimonadetes bacterium]|nr:hypothetical protein [Gemmatimonadota bacterium]